MDSSKGYKYRCCASTSSRVAFLQYQLQDLSERECRARNYNRKLLQKFQRAQNTLSELVARTEAMNTIRMDYYRFLEQNYSEWQQKLQDKSLSEKGKVQRIGRGSKHSIINNTTLAISPDPSYCPHVHSLQHMADRSTNVAKGEVFPSDSKQNMQGNIQNSVHLSFPSIRLTQLQLPFSEVQNLQGHQKHPELNMSNYYGDISESSDLSSNAVKSLLTEVQLKKMNRTEIKQTHNIRKDAVSQESASTSDRPSVLDHKKHKKIKQSTWRNAAYKTSKVAVDSPKQLVKEIKDDSQRIEGTITNICCTVEKEALQIYENKGEKEDEEANRYSTENEEQRASLCEVQDAEGGIKERYRKQNSSDEEQAQEEEALCSNTSVKESVLEEEDSVGETEEEEEEEEGGGEEEQQEEDGEKEDENKETSGRRKGTTLCNTSQMNQETYSHHEVCTVI
ncbi:hypothetical protein HF521_018489 [Silurus meridionalis]|uniref:Uncharacterized protein n=1 Tax=Silurus meridionalis TaxID=175797 RepID=A0A8T0BJ49_SILME|nr:hypothetical protein HF521_018489 [Silurus meridionalis]